MAEQNPFGVAVSVINNLASFAFDEFGRIYGVKDELEKLKETLESIKVVTSDADQGRGQDPVNEHWIRRFRQVLLDADDLLDDLAIKDLRRRVDGGSKFASKVRDFFSSENPLVFRAKLARKIDDIRKNYRGIAEDMSNLKLNPSSVIQRQNENDWLRNERETSSFVLQSDIIGREESKNDIVGLLVQTHASQNVSVVAIVGIGGLGKTALAQLAYNDAVVQNHFHKKMWVCVSEDFNVKLLLKKVLKSLKEDMEVDDLALDSLQKKLQDELNGQRYILVLDDLWNENQQKWDALRPYLMCGDQGSKILVTTRSKMVSKTMGVRNPYDLEGLKEEQSWTLLKNLTFGEDTSKMSTAFESIGIRIAEKCGGVPLAIKTMGSYLRGKQIDEWSSILNADIWRLCEESESIMPVLKLSYQSLSLTLRQCFAYCSLYPKDQEILKDQLIQLWIAQGYLASSTKMQSMEDVGNEYVKILLMRSFFQDVSIDEYGDITKFKMHDLMHDLALLVAQNDCYVVPKEEGIVGRPLHVAFEPSNICSLDMLDASKVRTIICHYPAAESMTNPPCMKKLKYIRVLDLWGSSITQLPQSIDKIKHLRYLDLSYCQQLISLPKSIRNLVCLQTLKLQGCRKLVFPVQVISKLINLRHLEIRNCKAFEEMMPTGLGKLTSLQYLSSFVVRDNVKRESGKLNELKELNNIRGKLEISELCLVEDVTAEAQEANLVTKKHIQQLRLSWGREEVNKNSDSLQLLDYLCPHQNLRELVVDAYPGERFSSWISTLKNIVKIELYELYNCQHLPPLERLPCLKKLKIWFVRELQCIHYEEISDVFFPSLETLILTGCDNLRGWQRLGDDSQPNDIGNHLSLPPFPRLSSLNIQRCPYLNCMPTFPHLVEDLVLDNCSMNPLIETCLVQLEPSSLIPLHRLRHMKIEKVTEAEALAENWMRNFKNLESLSLLGSNMTQHISHHLQHLPSQIQELGIGMSDNDTLYLWEYEENNGTQCAAPFHCLRSLQKIIFTFCKNLRALPEQIGDLQSLRHIEISWCPELESLPEATCRLTNLQSLRIHHCPLLLDRCRDESGQDWPKIAHIPKRDRYIA